MEVISKEKMFEIESELTKEQLNAGISKTIEPAKKDKKKVKDD